MNGGSMATKSENADIRELQTEMVNINKTFSDFKDNDFKEVKEGVKTLLAKFEEQKNLQTEIDYLKGELSDLKKRRTFSSVVIPIVASVFTALLTFLVINFLTRATPSANNPTTSTTTTVNNPAGSTSTTSTKDGTTSASATAHSDATNPNDSQTSNGGVQVTAPKVP